MTSIKLLLGKHFYFTSLKSAFMIANALKVMIAYADGVDFNMPNQNENAYDILELK